jgi:hypothetical protein
MILTEKYKSALREIACMIYHFMVAFSDPHEKHEELMLINRNITRGVDEMLVDSEKYCQNNYQYIDSLMGRKYNIGLGGIVVQ